MKTAWVALLLLSLALTACIVAPGPGYGDRGYDGGDRGYYGGDRGYYGGDRGGYDGPHGYR
jgi:hypothetical protein